MLKILRHGKNYSVTAMWPRKEPKEKRKKDHQTT